jgi:hypothetical protein
MVTAVGRLEVWDAVALLGLGIRTYNLQEE